MSILNLIKSNISRSSDDSSNQNPLSSHDTSLHPNLRPNFWQNHSLSELNEAEWEALCDGCGVCCLIKFLDEDDSSNDTPQVEYTDVACRLLNCQTGHCQDYTNRQKIVPDCIKLTPAQLPLFSWLPSHCAYKRLYLGKPLPKWHYLITGNKQTTQKLMKKAGIGIAGRCVSESDFTNEEIEERIIHWIQV